MVQKPSLLSTEVRSVTPYGFDMLFLSFFLEPSASGVGSGAGFRGDLQDSHPQHQSKAPKNEEQHGRVFFWSWSRY